MTEFMGLAEKVSKFNQEALKHMERQTLNPFSGRFSRSPSPRPKFGKDEYGKPAAGSKTEMRGQRAHTQISREVLELCTVIHDMGRRRRDADGDECIIIPFGELFAFYTKISDKVVGLLIAAKKRGFVWFEPEILFQRRDDDVLIALLKPIGEIRNVITRQISGSPSPAPAVSSEPEKTSPCPTPSPLARQGSSTPPEPSAPSSTGAAGTETHPTPDTLAAVEEERVAPSVLVPEEPTSKVPTETSEPPVENKEPTPSKESLPSEDQANPSTTASDAEPIVSAEGSSAAEQDQDSLTLKVIVEVEPGTTPDHTLPAGEKSEGTTDQEQTPPSGDTGEKTLA